MKKIRENTTYCSYFCVFEKKGFRNGSKCSYYILGFSDPKAFQDKTSPKDLKNLEVYLMTLKRPSKSKFPNAEL